MSTAPKFHSDHHTHSVPFTHFEQLRTARLIIKKEANALSDLSSQLDANFCTAVEILHQCAGRVVVTGIGKAGLIGQKISATLSSTGTRSQFLHPTEAVHGDIGCLDAGDVLLAISNSGETEEVCRLIPTVKQLKVPVVSITASEASTLGQDSDIVISLGRLQEAGEYGLAPSTSTTAMLAVGDALALVVSRMKNFTPQDFALFHPGGSLGRKLTMVRDIMRKEDELRISTEDTMIREVFVTLSQPGRRTGAVIVVDTQGYLAGLFTDSDLARLFEQDGKIQFERPIQEVMTSDPLTIDCNATLVDAVDLLSMNKVSELPVVDADGRPIGLIDITDVIGLMPSDETA